MAQFLLDTTFFIDLQRGDSGAARTWQRIELGDLAAAYSTITAYELWLNRSLVRSDEVFYQALFMLLEEAPLTTSAATQTALWMRPLPRRTRNRRIRDAFIAASARQRGEVILTRNVRDMRRYHPNVRRY